MVAALIVRRAPRVRRTVQGRPREPCSPSIVRSASSMASPMPADWALLHRRFNSARCPVTGSDSVDSPLGVGCGWAGRFPAFNGRVVRNEGGTVEPVEGPHDTPTERRRRKRVVAQRCGVPIKSNSDYPTAVATAWVPAALGCGSYWRKTACSPPPPMSGTHPGMKYPAAAL